VEEYLFGHGNFKLNPIDGQDLAKVCVDNMQNEVQEESVGGMDIFTQNQLAELALKAWGTIWILRTFTSSKTYGPIEFFPIHALFNVFAKY